MWTRAELKEKAKLSLNNNYWKVVLASLLIVVIGGGFAGAAASFDFNIPLGMDNTMADFESSIPFDDSIYYDEFDAGFEDDIIDDQSGYSEQYGDKNTSATYWNGYHAGYFGNSQVDDTKDYIDGYNDGKLDAEAGNEFGGGYISEDEFQYEDEYWGEDEYGFGMPDEELDKFNSAMQSTMIGVFVVAILFVLLIALAVGLVVTFAYNALIVNPICVGTSRFFFKNLNEKAEIKEVAYAFDNNYKNVIKILFHRDLKIFLWSLLFVIPGIIKKYECCMMGYLLAENPNLTKEETFRLSKQMMEGNKWRAFVLDLSFILWDILSIITAGIVGIFYVGPYKNLTKAALYEELSAINGYPARAARVSAEGGYAQYNPWGYESSELYAEDGATEE